MSFNSAPEETSHQISQTWPELQYWDTETILQQGTKNAKLPVRLGVDVLSPCAVTLQGDYIQDTYKKAHEEEEPEPWSSCRESLSGAPSQPWGLACSQPRFQGKLQHGLLQTKGCATREGKAEPDACW